MGRTCSTHWRDEKCIHKVLVGKSERRRALGRLGRVWEDNVTIYFYEIGYEVANWINLAQDGALAGCFELGTLKKWGIS